jgi:magnesium-transporting ATPase (P-type)
LLEATELQAEESALTGESVPAAKDVREVAPDAGLGDRNSMVHSGTLIAAGTGTGVVVATGQTTEIGAAVELDPPAVSFPTSRHPV